MNKALDKFFVHNNQSVAYPDGKRSVRLGDRLTVSGLRLLFPEANVSATVGVGEECPWVCATVTAGRNSFEVFFNETGNVVVGLRSADVASSDVLGNHVGDSMIKATGRSALCRFEEGVTCKHAMLDNLWIHPGAEDKCTIDPSSSGNKRRSIRDVEVMIPDCAIIGAFVLKKG